MRLPLCVILITFVIFSYSNGLEILGGVEDPKILKEMITKSPGVFQAALGHGRTYSENSKTVSRSGLIESDHIPPYAILNYIYKNAVNLPPIIKNIVDERNKIEKNLKRLKQALNNKVSRGTHILCK